MIKQATLAPFGLDHKRHIFLVDVVGVRVLTVNCVLVRFGVHHVPLDLLLVRRVRLRLSKRVRVFDVICTDHFHKLLCTCALLLDQFSALLHHLYRLVAPPLRLMCHEARGRLLSSNLRLELAMLPLAAFALRGDRLRVQVLVRGR